MGQPLFIDLETSSKLDLKKCGAPRYTRSIDRVLAIGHALNIKPIKIWKPGDPLDFISDHDGIFVAHNAEFERQVLLNFFGIDIPIERWHCTAALARFNNLPGSLDQAAKMLDLGGKHSNKKMLKLSKPRRNGEFWQYEDCPEDFEEMYEYCKQDVHLMRLLWLTLPPMSKDELEVYHLTARINDRGFAVDLKNIEIARREADLDRRTIDAEVKRLTDGIGASQVARLTEWLHVPSLAKADIQTALKGPLSSEQRRVLELRLQYALSATKKLDAFLNHHVEGRIHDGLIYAGASQTLRWSGSGVQPQNMPRGLGAATSDVFEHVHQDGFPDEVRDDNGFLYRGKQNVIKQLIRGFITGPLLVGDFAQIEARVLAWVCRQEDMLQAFVNKEDPYKLMASKIYEKPIEDIDGSERFFGKTAVLGAGYGLGPGSFQRMLEQTYGREITDSQAADIILAYRSAAPRVVSLWEALDRAISMKKSIWLNRELNMYLDWGGKKKDRLCIHLPSGRTIWYYSLKDLYGGKLTGHMVQSIARDLMAHTLRQLDKAGFDLVLTVHDEAVAEAPESRLAEFDSVMRRVPDWAKALPVDVECFATDRYRK